MFLDKLFGKIGNRSTQTGLSGEKSKAQTKSSSEAGKKNVQNNSVIRADNMPDGYREMTFGDFKFYYRSEEVDYNFQGDLGRSKLLEHEFEHDHDVTNSQSVYTNKKGGKSLMIYVSVPTFDSEDREWDSYRKLFLVPEEGIINGFMVSGGYKIAEILSYTDIRFADEKTEKILMTAGIF